MGLRMSHLNKSLYRIVSVKHYINKRIRKNGYKDKKNMTKINIKQQVNNFNVHPIGYNYVNSIRSTGYSFCTAMGELIDNAIDAGASTIHLTLEKDEKDKLTRVIIQDNGCGMDHKELLNSFTLGAQRPYKTIDIGKYGKGGTEGPLGIARKKYTYTKRNGVILGQAYDLQIVKQQDKWGSFPIAVPQDIEEMFGPADGTIIILDDIDRARYGYKTTKNRIESYISQTYNNYLVNELITVNNVKMDTWDPLFWKHPKTIQLEDVTLDYKGCKISVKAAYLVDVPNKVPKNSTLYRSQGGYIYRNGRIMTENPLTDSNGLSGFYVAHSDYNNLRWSVEYSPDADIYMGTSSRKDAIQMEQALNHQVSAVIGRARSWTSNMVRNNKKRKNQNSVATTINNVTNALNAFPRVAPKKTISNTAAAPKQASSGGNVTPFPPTPVKATKPVKDNFKMVSHNWSEKGDIGKIIPGTVKDSFDWELQINADHPTVIDIANETPDTQESFFEVIAAVLIAVAKIHDPQCPSIDDLREDMIEDMSKTLRRFSNAK